MKILNIKSRNGVKVRPDYHTDTLMIESDITQDILRSLLTPDFLDSIFTDAVLKLILDTESLRAVLTNAILKSILTPDTIKNIFTEDAIRKMFTNITNFWDIIDVPEPDIPDPATIVNVLGSPSVGTSNRYAREDHIHQLPTIPALAIVAPRGSGIATAGSSNRAAREDHVHPHTNVEYDMIEKSDLPLTTSYQTIATDAVLGSGKGIMFCRLFNDYRGENNFYFSGRTDGTGYEFGSDGDIRVTITDYAGDFAPIPFTAGSGGISLKSASTPARLVWAYILRT